MYTLRIPAFLAVVCAATAAAADPSVWDRTYRIDGRGGNWNCPNKGHDVVVAEGRFSIAWDVELEKKESVTIGYIEGAVRPSGLATATVRFVEPLPPEFVATMTRFGESIDKVRASKFKVDFDGGDRRERQIAVTTAEGCYAYWKENRAAMYEQSAAPLDCAAGKYAVAAWSAKRAYRTGELAQLWSAGDPTRVYRCVDACAAGTDPRTSDSHRPIWAFVGECARSAGAAPPKPAKLPPGSARWDVAYSASSSGSEDWRCPTSTGFRKVAVQKGSFSIPWAVRTNRGEDTVGIIEGSIADDGTTTVVARVTITELSPELLESNPRATLPYLRALTPTMKFILDTGKMNPKGQGRRAELNFGTVCEYTFEASDYKPQQFREEDGWRVKCPRELAWDSRGDYRSGEHAVVGSHRYVCSRSRCTTRPDRSSEWEKTGRCE